MALTAQYRSSALTDPGRKRENNEDRYILLPERGIFGVIDGVGGQNAGEMAAKTAQELIEGRLLRQVGDVEERIREGITVANNEIHRLAKTNSEWQGMACVLTLAVVSDGEITLGQVGDSRAYLIQQGQIRKLTHDHSPVGEREDRGEIDEATAMRHPRRNEVYRDVGTQEHSPDDSNFIEIGTSPFPSNAALLICSDGLSDLVPAAEILAAVEANAGYPEAAARTLIEAANAAGGKDNITVVVVMNPAFRPLEPVRTQPGRELPSRAEASPWPGRTLALFLGIALALGAVYALKPYWTETQRFGMGPVPEPRTLRVVSDLRSILESARTGDTVVVPPGIYQERITLKEGVRLIAESPRQAVLSVSGVAVTAAGLTSGRIEGFRIVPGEGEPLLVGMLISNANIDVIDNEITGCTNAAIELQGQSSGTLRANHIYSNSGSGVLLAGHATTRLAHNVINGNTKAGVVVLDGARPSFTGNSFTRNGEDFSAPPSFNRDELLLKNYLSPAEPPKPPRPVRPRTR